MPPLPRPAHPTQVTLPPRTAQLATSTDVLVVGGGPAGIGAATGAAEAGAEVVLAERYGFLGGNATVALVMPLMSFHNERKQAVVTDHTRMLPTDHGEGDPLIAGVLGRMLERLTAAGGAIPPSGETGYTVPFDPEQLKLVLQDMLDEAGVRLLFHAFASGTAPANDGGHRVVFETKSGPIVIDARVVVDCTGDGDVAAAAGAPYDVGREEDDLVQPMTLQFRMVDVVTSQFAHYVRDHPDQWRGVHGLWNLIRDATEAGELELPREDMLFFGTPHPREISFNSTRVTGVLATDVWDLTLAELVSRRQMAQIAQFVRSRVPGFAEAYIAQSGMIGARESRRFCGDYQITGHDVLAARKFPDGIAQCAYPVDIHNPEGSGTLLRRVPSGESYDIPLRSLVPRDVDALIVAGRCISGTHVAHSSYRIMPVCMATGQAAGVCAALAVSTGQQPRDVPAADVQRVLRKQGARLRPGLG